MLDDTDDFCDVKKNKEGSAAASVKSGSSKDKGALVLRIHSKWETAPFVKRLQQTLQESKPDRYTFEFTAAPESPLKSATASAGNNSSLLLSSDNQVDLEVRPEGLSVLILTEPEYVGGNSLFKRRLAKFYSVKKGAESVVVCVRSPQTPPQDFIAVQTFAVIELGLALIPIAENLERHLPQLLVQLLALREKKKKNPFKLGVKAGASTKRSGPLAEVLTTLQCIPGLGDKKAKALLQEFGSLKAIAEADLASVTAVVGHASAVAIGRFFRLEKENESN